MLAGGGLAAVLAADLSGLSLAETERIWQPFMPLVLVAGGALALGRRDRGRPWLSAPGRHHPGAGRVPAVAVVTTAGGGP